MKLNKEWHDDGQDGPPEIRTRIKLLVHSLEYIEPEIQGLRLDDCKSISRQQLEELIDLRNKSHHYLKVIRGVQSRIRAIIGGMLNPTR
jgi:hypothetical protein